MAEASIKASGAVMYFDDAHIALYVVPKAACTSIKRLLAHTYMKPEDKPLHRMLGYKQSVHRLRDGGYRKGYFKIAICRNPWERAMSTYMDKVIEKKLGTRLESHGFYKGMSFYEFIQHLSQIPDFGSDKHIKSQYFTVFRDGPPDFLARVETLGEDWKQIQRYFSERGGKTIPALGKLNSSLTKRPEWAKETYELVTERYSKDIELLGYQKEKEYGEYSQTNF